MFISNVKIYVYFVMQEGSVEFMIVQNVLVFEGVKFLYCYLFDNQQIEDVFGYNFDILYIFLKDVLIKI